MSDKVVYRVQVLQTGLMPEAPSCGIRFMSDLGSFEPMCYTMVVARAEGAGGAGGGRTVVINAGFPDDIEPLVKFWKGLHPRSVLQRAEGQRVEKQLARIGVDPAMVDDFVLSPIGPYSTGKIELFSGATIHIGRREWLELVAPERDVPADNPHEIAMPAATLARLVTSDWGRVRLLEEEDEVCPGVRVFRTGGHHRGSMAVVIETAAGPVVYADTIFSYGNLEKNVAIGFCRSMDDYHRAVARIRREAGIIVPAFDPEVFGRYPDGVIA